MTVEGAIDVTSDQGGGVLKTIKQQGVGTASPSSGDTVYVHYVGTLDDGTEFDSSRKRGEPFSFNLGRGDVIKGWDVGVATMTKAEVATLRCSPAYAYGESGSPPKIPPNTTLNFEVELLRWEGEDISPDRDKTIVRSVQVSGEHYELPNDGATCHVHIIGRYEDKEFFNKELNNLIVGESTELGLPEGIDRALKRFRAGEHSVLQMKPKWGYGSKGKSDFNIPPDASLEFEVKLIKFDKVKESWQMDKTEKLAEAEQAKVRGTEFFQNGKYRLAIAKYQRIIDLLGSEDKLEGEEKTKRDTLYAAAQLNCALCCLKGKDATDCIRYCDNVLEKDPGNVKALYRKAVALQETTEYDDALALFTQVRHLEPQNKAAEQGVRQCKVKIKEQTDKDKKLFANMFQKFAEQDFKASLNKKPEEKGGEESEAVPDLEEKGSGDVDMAEG